MRSIWLIGQREIDLPFESINSRHEHAKLVADRKTFSCSAPNQAALGAIKHVEIVGQRRNVDQPAYQHVWQFDDQAIIAHINDRGAESFGIMLGKLLFEELELFHPDSLDFGFISNPFSCGNMLRHHR